jgi:N-acetylglucosaminyldiphosphoundecaprenol N-acetyl-beta-D-mannosaminyltransferase
MTNISYFFIGNVKVSATNINDTINFIENQSKKKETIQICVLDFNAACNAQKDKNYRQIINNAGLSLPDGVPLIWLAKISGLKGIAQTPGPEIFDTLLKKHENKLKHFLLGDTEEVLNKIENKYINSYNSNIVGKYSPAFIDISEYDMNLIAALINKSNADIVWISMTSPKQDFFGYLIAPQLENKIIIGVGAAFRYSIGIYKLPSGFKRKIGLAGFMRKDSFLKELKWYSLRTIHLIKFAAKICLLRFLNKNNNLSM